MFLAFHVLRIYLPSGVSKEYKPLWCASTTLYGLSMSGLVFRGAVRGWPHFSVGRSPQHERPCLWLTDCNTPPLFFCMQPGVCLSVLVVPPKDLNSPPGSCHLLALNTISFVLILSSSLLAASLLLHRPNWTVFPSCWFALWFNTTRGLPEIRLPSCTLVCQVAFWFHAPTSY